MEKYIYEQKKFYDLLLIYLSNANYNESFFQILINFISIEHYIENEKDFNHFLHFLANIANNHHHDESFFTNFFQIIRYYTTQLKQTFSNFEIYDIFKSNKKIILYLFQNSIIELDEEIFKEMVNTSESNGNRYCHFFYPEIEKYIGEKDAKNLAPQPLPEDFFQKRQEGENDSYLCSLIRRDSINDFVSYVNRYNIQLTSEVKHSIFETNTFLIENNPSLIEYSAFFGSLKIFNYLKYKDVKLEPSLWLYAIHSGNIKLIHILEESDVKLPNDRYDVCFIESIKCHNNDLVNYFERNFLNSITNEMISSILHYSNYFYFPPYFKDEFEFFYLCLYKYETLADLFIKMKEKENGENLANDELLKEAAEQNQISVIYHFLSQQTEIHRFMNIPFKQLVLPPSIKSIGDSSFEECSSLTHIVIPSSVTKICDKAFIKCSSLTQVEIPSSVISIGEYAFNSCTSLKEIKIPPSVKTIGSFAFGKCSSLSRMTIHYSITSISMGTFERCSSLRQITIPSSVVFIGDCAFQRCSSLRQITIPSSVIKIGNRVFQGCSLLEEIELPTSVNSIGDYTFSGCRLIKKITIPPSVLSIRNYSFSKCILLIEITIPSSVLMIGANTFEHCSSLKQITIPSSVSFVGDNAFYRCSSLKEINILSKLTSFESNLFNGCSSLTQITIPSSVKMICEGAFKNCGTLKQITIPSSVSYIGSEAFSSCSSLSQITIHSSVIEIEEDAFIGCPNQPNQ